MPLVLRKVSPVRLSDAKLHDARGRPTVDDRELEAVSNVTLCRALKQLASVLNIAHRMFGELDGQLHLVKDKSSALKLRIDDLERAVDRYDPKNVTVPVGDMTWFSGLGPKRRYQSRKDAESSTDLFTVGTRPPAIEALYSEAAKPTAPRCSSPTSVTVTPVLGRTQRRQVSRLPQVDIETRKPAALAGMRKWTSTEALGDLTSDPDGTVRVDPTPDSVHHTLPSPEERLQAIATKFPGEVVLVDVSGKSFDRMSDTRRSLVIRRSGASRRRRSRRQRRNTIATTDPTEIHKAASDSTETVLGKGWNDAVEKKSQLEALKEWGLDRLRSLRPQVSRGILESRAAVTMRLAAGRKSLEPHSSSGNWSASSESGHSTATHHPRSSISSSSGCLKQRKPVSASTCSSVTSESSTVTPENDFETGSMYSCDTEGYYTSFHLDSGLKPLREEEPTALSSRSSTLSQGLNAESEYELFGRGSTSTTASSAGTVCTALPAPPPRRDSHLTDAGNRTFPERSRPLRPHTRSLRASDHDNLTHENLCIHNNVPPPDIVRRPPEKCGDSPDSGHNTCSSPVDSVASPLDVVSECSDLEGVDRVERIREKTTIDSSRIPSMCVITPPQSDDEVGLEAANLIDSGEYVTIAEVQQTVTEIISTELVSLNNLGEEKDGSSGVVERRRTGARVTLDSQGKVIYSSDSLKRKKRVHTTGTFEPGPCVTSFNNSPVAARTANIRPIRAMSPDICKNDVTSPQPTKQEPALLTKESNVQSTTYMPPLSPTRLPDPKQPYIPRSPYERENPSKSINPLYPVSKRGKPAQVKSPVQISKPVVKAGSPTRSLSPVVSRGAYVRIRQPSDDLPLHSSGVNHSAVKRSDSYRLANPEPLLESPRHQNHQPGGVAALPSPTLTPLRESPPLQDTKGESEKKAGLATPASRPLNASTLSATRTTERNTPTCPSEDLSTPNKTLNTSVYSGGKPSSTPLTSTPTKNLTSPLDFSTVPSPIEKSVSKSNRSAMDLFAVIHDSKKKIKHSQKDTSSEQTKTDKTIKVSNETEPAIARPPPPMSDLNAFKYARLTSAYASLPKMKLQNYEQSPTVLGGRRRGNDTRRGSDEEVGMGPRRGWRGGAPAASSRDDFKRLLLRTGTGVALPRRSAVDRLSSGASIPPLAVDKSNSRANISPPSVDRSGGANIPPSSVGRSNIKVNIPSAADRPNNRTASDRLRSGTNISRSAVDRLNSSTYVPQSATNRLHIRTNSPSSLHKFSKSNAVYSLHRNMLASTISENYEGPDSTTPALETSL